MASSGADTGAEGGGRETQEQDSSLDWMLDSSHVNVGLWNHFDGHRFVTEEQGVHDREGLQQQGSSLDRSLPPSHVNVDVLGLLDRRVSRAEEQGTVDREEGLRGRLDAKCFDPSDIALDFSPTLNNAHYHNTSARFIQDNPPSWTSGSTVGFIKSSHEQHTNFSRSIFDGSDYNHVSRPALRDNYGRNLHDFEMGYGYPYLFDRTSQTRPLVDWPSGYGTVTTDFKDWYNPDTAPDNSQNALAKRGEKPHTDVLPSPKDGSHQLQESVWNQSVKTYDQIFPEDPWASPSVLGSDRPFKCQRCNYTRSYNREADLQRHMAAHHSTRKVWITVDISPDKKFLANCKPCRMGKRYGAYKNAAAHLRRVHFTPTKGFRDHKYVVSSGPTMKALMTWMQELEEDIDTEHQVSQLPVPEIRVLDASQGNADFHSLKNDLSPPRGGRHTALPLNASSPSTESERKKQCTYPEAGRSATHNRGANTLDGQLLAPYPKRQKMASQHRSADSGYVSDGMTHSNQLNGVSIHCPKSTDDRNLAVKSELIDPDADLIALIPKDESHHHSGKQVKEEPSETPKADTKPSRGSGCKGEHESEYLYMKNSSANKHPGKSQHSSERYNLKRKRNFHPPPTLAVISEDSKSESIVDVDSEKQLPNSIYHKADYKKDDVRTIKAEPNHVKASFVTAGIRQPVISINMEPSHPKHRSTRPLPFGHPKSRQWTEMLPSIKACTREIMGKGNRGALELFQVDGEPTICITCWDPLKLNLALVRSCMEPLGLHINVTQGKIGKSASGEHDDSSGAAVSDQGQCMLPSIHGHYMQRPTCGASLGVADGPLKSGKVSLGGYLKIKHFYRHHWSYYAMTVHHILVADDREAQSSSITSNDEDEEMAEPGYDYSPGVHNGLYNVGDGPGVKVSLSCPAVPDVRSLVTRLEGRCIKRCANESYAAIDNLDNLDDLLNKVCTRENTKFGKAAWSSGLDLDQDVEMDWLLIGDLPINRIGCNRPGDVTAFMEGSHQASVSKGCWTPSAYVDESAFSTLMNFSAQEWGKPGSEGGYLSRVFGRGSETGLADGFLSHHPSVFYDETYGSYDAWAFTPRYTYGLGDSGDSGTWIFTSEGKLLGQIISYNRARHITYFTPVCKIFNHIKRITGATDVELLTPEDVAENPRVAPKSAGGLLSPEEEIFKLNNRSKSTITNSSSSADSSAAQERFFPPPRTPASEPLPFPFNHVHFSTAGLPTPGSTQAGDSSD